MRLGPSPVLDAIKQIWLAETMTDRTRSAGSPYYVFEPARSPLGTFPRSRDRPAGSRPEPLRRAHRSFWLAWLLIQISVATTRLARGSLLT